VALPDLSRDAAGHSPREILRGRLGAGFRRIAFFVVPSAFAFVGLGPTLVAALFQTGRFGPEDTRLVGGVLAAYGIGLLGAASIKLLASGFYALRDTRTPVATGVASMALSTGLALLLMRVLGAAGIALAASIGSTVNLVAQITLLERRIGPVLGAAELRALVVTAAGGLAATGAGVGTALSAAHLAPIPQAAVAAAAFGAVYAAITLALRHPDALRAWKSLRESLAS
jgi:putative peptidoglycan lipid II flippase